MVTYTFTNGTVADADEVNQNFDDVEQDTGLLGEVRMFALSMTGAVTKASLQGKGWAICDGTTPVAQGITSPTIETTPDLQEKFLRMSNDETSGTTGGSDTHNHTMSGGDGCAGADTSCAGHGYNSDGGIIDIVDTNSTSTLPSYYELAFFMKVKY